MNPNSSEQSNINLPPPAVGTESLGLNGQAVAPEKAGPEAKRRLSEPTTLSQAGPVNPAPVAAYVPPLQPMPAAQQTSSVPASPTAASDGDRIEKEWVAKAKQIIDATRDNPSAQAGQMSHVKADYLKKRFNRDLSIKS